MRDSTRNSHRLKHYKYKSWNFQAITVSRCNHQFDQLNASNTNIKYFPESNESEVKYRVSLAHDLGEISFSSPNRSNLAIFIKFVLDSVPNHLNTADPKATTNTNHSEKIYINIKPTPRKLNKEQRRNVNRSRNQNKRQLNTKSEPKSSIIPYDKWCHLLRRSIQPLYKAPSRPRCCRSV